MSDQAISGGPTGSPGTGDGGTGEPQQRRGHTRRTVMLGAAAVGAGAVAGVALPAEAATASSEAAGQAVTVEPLSVAVAVLPTISLAQVSALVARVGGLVGCRACGLAGVDFRLFGVDPSEVKQIQALETTPGVAGAVVLQQ